MVLKVRGARVAPGEFGGKFSGVWEPIESVPGDLDVAGIGCGEMETLSSRVEVDAALLVAVWLVNAILWHCHRPVVLAILLAC